MRYRAVNLSQQDTNVLLRHPKGWSKLRVPHYSLPAGLLKSCHKPHSCKQSAEEGATIWLHGGSFRNAAKAFSGAIISQKARQAHNTDGSQAPGGSSEARRATCVWSTCCTPCKQRTLAVFPSSSWRRSVCLRHSPCWSSC